MEIIKLLLYSESCPLLQAQMITSIPFMYTGTKAAKLIPYKGRLFTVWNVSYMKMLFSFVCSHALWYIDAIPTGGLHAWSGFAIMNLNQSLIETTSKAELTAMTIKWFLSISISPDIPLRALPTRLILLHLYLSTQTLELDNKIIYTTINWISLSLSQMKGEHTAAQGSHTLEYFWTALTKASRWSGSMSGYIPWPKLAM